jgi:hypothetical protein
MRDPEPSAILPDHPTTRNPHEGAPPAMTETITTVASGISAATLRCLEQGAQEFFARQRTGLLAQFARREGGNPLPGEFAALTAPGPWQPPAARGRV